MLVRSMSATIGSIVTDELICRSLIAAASALGRLFATSDSSNSTCRWRFDGSTKSRSMTRTKPTPARTRVFASTVPSAPQPQRVTRRRQQLLLPGLAQAGEAHLAGVAFEGVGVGHGDRVSGEWPLTRSRERCRFTTGGRQRTTRPGSPFSS